MNLAESGPSTTIDGHASWLGPGWCPQPPLAGPWFPRAAAGKGSARCCLCGRARGPVAPWGLPASASAATPACVHSRGRALAGSPSRAFAYGIVEQAEPEPLRNHTQPFTLASRDFREQGTDVAPLPPGQVGRQRKASGGPSL